MVRTDRSLWLAAAAFSLLAAPFTGCSSDDDSGIGADAGPGGGAGGGIGGQIGGGQSGAGGGAAPDPTGGGAAPNPTGGGAAPDPMGGQPAPMGGQPAPMGGQPGPMGGQPGPVGGAGGDISCDDIGVAVGVGEPCQNAMTCGSPWGVCLATEEGAMMGACRQLCIPGVCTDRCTEGQFCATLTGSPDAPPPELPDGTTIGACIDPPMGEIGVYQRCGANGACAGGAICAILDPNQTDGFCAPPCGGDGSCAPSAEGATTQCALGADPGMPTHCGAICENEGQCGADLRCVPAGGGNICQP